MAVTFHSKQPFEEVEHFINEDGEHLFCRHWKPEGEIKALLLVLHGFHEHCGRYDVLSKYTNELNIFQFGHDFTGNGESEGVRGNSFSYKIYVRDALKHAEIMKEKYPDLPMYIYGHSMGGGLAVAAVHKNPDIFDGMILSAPLITANPATATPLRILGAKLLGTLFPGIVLGNLPLSAATRSQETIKCCEDDPMFNTGGMSAGIAKEMLKFVDDLGKMLPDIKIPYFIAHGDSDSICNLGGSKLLHEVSVSNDKTFAVYPGMYHMLEHDRKEDAEKFLNDVKMWLSERVK